MREIHFYTTLSGRSPVEEFLESLAPKQVQKIAWVLRLVREMDVVPAQYLKKLSGTGELWEVRAAWRRGLSPAGLFRRASAHRAGQRFQQEGRSDSAAGDRGRGGAKA